MLFRSQVAVTLAYSLFYQPALHPVPGAASVPPEQETAAPVQTGVERYFVALQPDEALSLIHI